MNNIYITITGMNHYYGMKPFKIGHLVKLIKDKYNQNDAEAIKVVLPHIDTVGFVANSAGTVYFGTHSAGRIYDKIDDQAYAEIMFITHSSVIAQVLPPESGDKEYIDPEYLEEMCDAVSGDKYDDGEF